MPSIRYAKPSDAKRLAALAEETFRDTFGSVNAAEDMDLHCRTSYAEAVQLAEISNAGAGRPSQRSPSLTPQFR